ncbi:hypothetical protein C6497_08015 [Candidatus Poribacteria bacterium]|nr:MAG: hypothetical protein C6497_08015 [Candidatus Poribacteria bacterium]
MFMCVVSISFAGTWRDDFEDKDTKEWEIFNLNRQVEKWWINDDEAVGEIFEPGFWSLWMTGENNWQFYSVRCVVKLIDEKNDPPYFGLTLHDRGEEGGRYVFYVDYLRGFAVIEKWVANGGSVRQNFVAEKDVWYELNASVQLDPLDEELAVLEFSIKNADRKDGNPLVTLTAQDTDPIDKGQVSLAISNARVRYDNVEISGTNIPNGGPGKPFPVKPHAKLATSWGSIKKY